MIGSLPEELGLPTGPDALFKGAEIRNIQNQFSLATGMCKRSRVARTTHKTRFGVGFFLPYEKNKRALNSEELKILCCHSFQALLDLFIHKHSIFSLKISFSMPEEAIQNYSE